MLVGRRVERAELGQLLDGARQARSGVLVLRGEAGVGKTALVNEAVESASGFGVLRAVGVESEMELPFAALHQLCAPLLDRLPALPGPQQAALGAALGLVAGPAPERLLVGAATLGLLSAASDGAPLLCVIDDAQWLDQASAQALAFVARRLLADPVVMLFAARERTEELAGLPELNIEGLEPDEARELLALAVSGPLDPRVGDRIIAEAGGNPLALLELPRGMTGPELAVGFQTPEVRPVAARIEDSFRRRFEALPAGSRQLLLVAATDQLGDSQTVLRAAALLGVDGTASVPLSEAGLLEIGIRVRFRHPLVRSAALRAASPHELRAAHGALAEATDPELDPDRHAWHLAAAARGPDEEVATKLEQSAGRAQVRGGMAAAAALIDRAADLTPDADQQARRFLIAAGANLEAGAYERATSQLERAAARPLDVISRAEVKRMEGAIRFADGRGGETPLLLLDAAKALGDVDVPLAREVFLDALEAAMWVGQLSTGTTMADVARDAAKYPRPADDSEPPSLLLTGHTERYRHGPAAAAIHWRRAASIYLDRDESEVRQWVGMLWNATGDLLDYELNTAVARKWLRVAREQGSLSRLPVAMNGMAIDELHGGRIDAAEALVSEAQEISRATGAPSTPGADAIIRLAMDTWRGHDEARALGAAVIGEATARGMGLGVTMAQFFLTKLELGHGRYEEARSHAVSVFRNDSPYAGTAGLGDIVEAMVRAGDLEGGRAAQMRLSERATAGAAPWGLGLLARSQALLASDANAEDFYVEAIEHLERSGVVIEHARARLLYGEWLRRRRRRRDARLELRSAHEMFLATGGLAFAHRARVELLATGEKARERVPETRDELTPQEQQIAHMAAEGESNAGIAAQLFISPHTVAYHLRKVYGKLGVSSRRQLARAVELRPETALRA